VNALRVSRETIEPLAVGASELGAIMGCDPYTTPLQLWRRKRGLDPATVANAAMAVGTALEGPVVALARGHVLEPVRRNHLTFAHHTLPLFATPDAFVGRDRVLEAKVVGVRGAWDWDDDPPCRVQLQVQGQLLVTGRSAGYVAALIGTELRLYLLPADHVVQASIADAVTTFVERHLDPGIPPDPMTYGERWAELIDQLRDLDGPPAYAGPQSDAAGARVVAIRGEVSRLEDEAKAIRLELLGALVAAGATKLLGSGWTGTVQDTKAGQTLVVRGKEVRE
jgi:hypothetical protein